MVAIPYTKVMEWYALLTQLINSHTLTFCIVAEVINAFLIRFILDKLQTTII